MSRYVRLQAVGGNAKAKFLALTEIPPPLLPPTLRSLRRHLDTNCNAEPSHREVFEGARVHIFGDYYEDKFMMTVATIVFPDHIDHKHFEVTTQAPYITVGPIEAIGFHPPVPPEVGSCEKIYLDHLEEQYSEEPSDKSDESMEIAHVAIASPRKDPDDFYSEID